MGYTDKMLGLRELSAEEVSLVAGGDGPTAGEMEIQGMADNSVTIQSGENWAITNDYVYYEDTDANGYYDYAEFSSGGEVYVYDPVTDTWREKDEEPDDEDVPDDRDVEP